MPHHVRRGVLSAKSGQLAGSPLEMLLEDVVGAVAAERCSPRTREHGAVARCNRSVLQEPLYRTGRVLPEGTYPLLATFAMELNLERAREL